MGERNSQTKAIILSVKAQGENKRSVTALSPDLGIFYATVYGGPKSKLRSLAQQFNSGTAYIYTDESKRSRKLSDFDAENVHPTLRTNLYKMWAANLGAELVMKTKCAGDDKTSFLLLKSFIDGIDACDEAGARLGTIRFLWRYLRLLGVQPEIHECSGCGSELLIQKNPIYYVPFQSAFFCADCSSTFSDAPDTIQVTSGGLKYLAAINELRPGEVRAMKIEKNDAYAIKRLVYFMIEQAAGSKLNALESGAGIL